MGGLFGAIGSALGAVGAIGSAIEGNQVKQRNKGRIQQAYRQNVVQETLRQANTRESTNESLNARGVFTSGANATPSNTLVQQAAASGGAPVQPWWTPKSQRIAAGTAPYLNAASAGAAGATNTLSGGVNQQLTDQFALERKEDSDNRDYALQQNNDQYTATLGNAIGQAFGTAANVATGGAYGAAASAINKAGITESPIQMAGNYGPVNPSFTGGSSRGIVIGDGSQSNYGFSG